MGKIAKTVSVLLHPAIVPLYGLLVIFNGSVFLRIPFGGIRLYCILITLLFLGLLPLLSVWGLKKCGLIRNYSPDSPQERIYPILTTILLAFVGLFLLGKLPYTNVVQRLYLLVIIVLSAYAIVSLKWRISLHMTAMGSLCGIVTIIGVKYWGDVRYMLAAVVIATGLLASSRLFTNKNNPAQVYAGFIFGMAAVILIPF